MPLKKIVIILLTALLITVSLPACSAHPKFTDEGILTYGDLQVTILETGYERMRDGFVCDNSNYGHPYATVRFTCTEEATGICRYAALIKVKYTDGASWGVGNFSSTSSSYSPTNLYLDPGESVEITFENNATVRQCWSKSEAVKSLTLALRDRSGELKDLSVTYRP